MGFPRKRVCVWWYWVGGGVLGVSCEANTLTLSTPLQLNQWHTSWRRSPVLKKSTATSCIASSSFRNSPPHNLIMSKCQLYKYIYYFRWFFLSNIKHRFKFVDRNVKQLIGKYSASVWSFCEMHQCIKNRSTLLLNSDPNHRRQRRSCSKQEQIGGELTYIAVYFYPKTS